ncbi:MAG: hypothetical protein SFW67_05635 [Myxococcaceae bacterium]|nr:hypothetical protein [Myxococcaceae bacterium]
MTLGRRLQALGVLQGRGRQRTLLQLCQAGRLVGGLSVGWRVTPDEAIGPVTHAMGDLASRLKVLDVRTGPPMQLEVRFELPPDVLREDEGPRVRTEWWDVEDVPGLAHNLNDLYRDVSAVKLLVVLGEWEDMVQLWALPRPVLRALLDEGLLDDARNAQSLRGVLEA